MFDILGLTSVMLRFSAPPRAQYVIRLVLRGAGISACTCTCDTRQQEKENFLELMIVFYFRCCSSLLCEFYLFYAFYDELLPVHFSAHMKQCGAQDFITSAKEDMLSALSVCLSVCLLVC